MSDEKEKQPKREDDTEAGIESTVLFSKDELMKLAIHLYNSGYHAGHHDTVEGGYTDILTEDMDSYHEEEVLDLVNDLKEYGYVSIV